jgi:OOP family OmpA-OmpF porin
MRYRQSFQVILAILSLLVTAAAASSAQPTSHPGYVFSTDGVTPAHDRDGHCIRTMEWRKEFATKECNPELLPAPAVVAPAPVPTPAPAPKSEPAPEATGAVVEKDSDNDGVPDSRDKCPNTNSGLKVDANGCPIDSDNDGVPDYLDKCPNTPAGVKVDANGCPIDSDNDGVPDYLDKCPNTPPGVKVDANGCPVPLTEKVSIALEINFDSGKTEVKQSYYDQIQKVADFMTAYPDTSAVIEGHTDNVGKEAANKALSQKRAESVKALLVNKYGISAGRLTAKGFGSSQPLADNATVEGRQKNRRINAVLETMTKK